MSTTAVIDADAEDVTRLVPVAPKAARKRRTLIAAVALLLLIAVAGAAYALFGSRPAETAAGSGASAQTYVDVPPMIVNLRSSDGRARFLKLHFMLVAADAGKSEGIKAKLPAYLDALQPFLRELRPEDLSGSAAVFRIKEEMLVRAGDALGKNMVRDVLIQDLIQQ
ncbi:MAG TPA: flagellar basal body-associated FliL family protein [Sphingomonadaceae bacterium]|nr:flagellar basal body-associated FliL family protein [Sphingomonadaceae bacterium]